MNEKRLTETRATLRALEKGGLSETGYATDVRDLLSLLDVAIARAKDAEAKLAALRESALVGAKRIESHLLRNEYAQQGSALRIMEEEIAAAERASEGSQ